MTNQQFIEDRVSIVIINTDEMKAALILSAFENRLNWLSLTYHAHKSSC